jgi:hypothetical protein
MSASIASGSSPRPVGRKWHSKNEFSIIIQGEYINSTTCKSRPLRAGRNYGSGIVRHKSGVMKNDNLDVIHSVYCMCNCVLVVGTINRLND